VRHLIAVVLAPLISGCGLLFSSYNVKPYDEINVFPSSSYGRYVLQVRYHVTRRGGNVHDITDLSKFEEDVSELLYVNSLQGKVTADAIVYKLFRGDTLSRVIRGYIEFDSGFVTINLEKPIYESGTPTNNWDAYRFNGTYRLKLAPNLPSERTPAGAAQFKR